MCTGKTLATYVWKDGKAENFKSITRAFEISSCDARDLPVYSFSESSSEVYLYPCAVYRNPFYHERSLLVLCEAFEEDGSAAKGNFRSSCRSVYFRKDVFNLKPTFKANQQYSLFDMSGVKLEIFENEFSLLPGNIEGNKIMTRDLIECYYRACSFAGIRFYETSTLWELQVGPCAALSIGDDLLMAQYLLHRLAETFQVAVKFNEDYYLIESKDHGAHGDPYYNVERILCEF